jgi:TolA-binding protein
VARITRKELKSDKFALEIEHTVSFFEEHQKEIVRYGGIAAALVVLAFGYVVYSRHQQAAREETLGSAIQVQETPVGQAQPGQVSFPTQAARDEAATRAFSDIVSKYPGTVEGEIAQYYLGSIKADQGDMAGAEKLFQEVAQKGDEKYSSLAKMSLAQIAFATGKDAQGEAVLRDLMAHPTLFVSKDQAAIALARFLMIKKPAEARKLLDPIKLQSGPVGQVALTLSSQLPPQ